MTRAGFSADGDVVVVFSGGGGGRLVRLDSESSGGRVGSERVCVRMGMRERMRVRERRRERVRVLGDGIVEFGNGILRADLP